MAGLSVMLVEIKVKQKTLVLISAEMRKFLQYYFQMSFLFPLGISLGPLLKLMNNLLWGCVERSEAHQSKLTYLYTPLWGNDL